MKTKGMVRKWFWGMSLAGLLTASLWAEDASSTQQRDKNNSQQEMSRKLVVLRTSQLIGQEVKNPQSQTLGKIYDLVLTSDRSQVAYIALSSGGILGMGDDLYAVPWSSLQISSDKQSSKGLTEGNKQADHQDAGVARTYILNISKARLEKQNGFKQDRWPKEGNLHWDGTSSSELQATDTQDADSDRTTEQNRQATLTSQELETRLISKLTGREVQNYEGEKIGKVEEFVIARQHAEMQSNSYDIASMQTKGPLQAKDHMFVGEGKLLYATIALGGFLGFGEEYALVPANKVSFMTQRDHALLLADKTKLQAVAFKANEWPDLSSPAYAKEVYDSFDASDYWTVLGYRSPLPEQGVRSWQAWAPDSSYNKKFDAKSIKTINGAVASVNAFEPIPGVRDGLQLRIKADGGLYVTVQVGPRWYAERKGFSFAAGDKVTVTGSEVGTGDQTVIMAITIDSDSKTLFLRSKNGSPEWKRDTLPSQ